MSPILVGTRDPVEGIKLALECGAIIGAWEWDIANERFTGDDGCARALSLDFASHDGWLPLDVVVHSIHPEDWPSIEAVKGSAMTIGGCFSLEYRALRPDGSYRWIQSNGRCDIGADGNPGRFAGVLIDIDARKRIEERLRQSEAEAREATALLRAIVAAVPALIYFKDRDGRMQLANAAVMELVGKPWEEIRQRTDAEFLDDKDEAALVMANDRRLMETAGSQELEETVGRGAHGPRVWLSHKAAFRNDDGAVVGLLGTSVDITERKRAEQAVAANESRLRRIIDSVFSFVGILDLDGVLREVNKAPVTGAGLSHADVLGLPFWETHWWSYDPVVAARIEEAAVKAKKGETSRFDIEMRWRAESRIWIDFQMAPLRNDLGEIVQLIPSGADITARKQAEAQRQLLMLELDHRMKNLFAMASAIIHMTASTARTPVEMAKSAAGRLNALSRAHALIGPAFVEQPAGQGVVLNELIATIIAPHLDTGSAQLQISGEQLVLAGEKSTAFALVLHEMATNSAKYGALSNADGRLDISWSTIDGDLVFSWFETGGPKIDGPPQQMGFGSRLLRSTVEAQLGGTIAFEWASEGLRVKINSKLTG
jgi:PAS domain S-box-containing protein